MKRLLSFALLWLACFAAMGAELADITQQLAEQSARRELVRQRIAGLQTEILQTKGEHATLTGQLAAVELEISDLAKAMNGLEKQLSALGKDLHKLRQKQRREQQVLNGERALFERQLRSTYITGRQERLRVLLNQQDPALLSRALAYYEYFNRARARRMQEIQHRIDRLATIETDIHSREKELAQLKRDRQAEKQVLEQAQVQRQQIIAQLTQDLTQRGAILENLEQDEAQLNILLKGIQQVLQDLDNPQQQLFQKLRGKLPWPAKGRITASFGSSKIGSLRWDGVIITAREGQELRAVHAGRVAYADWLRGYGLLLIIDHGDAYMSLYGHNQSLFKETGDWVESGDVIGLVGRSGGQANPGIYFGIRHNGKAVNPARWCRKGKGKRVG